MSNQFTVQIDSQVINAAMRCDWELIYAHVENLRSKSVNPTLDKGTLVHWGLREFYGCLIGVEGPVNLDHRLELAINRIRVESIKTELPSTIVDEVIDAIVQYARFWAPRENLKVLAVETPFSVVLFENDEMRVVYVGIPDAVLGEKPFPMDHKSEGRRSDPNEMDNQFKGYCKALDSTTLLVNKVGFQTSLKPEEKFRRYPILYTEDALNEWHEEVVSLAYRIMELQIDTSTAMHNYTACYRAVNTQVVRPCNFLDICKTSRAIRNSKKYLFFDIGPAWDPYKRDKVAP